MKGLRVKRGGEPVVPPWRDGRFDLIVLGLPIAVQKLAEMGGPVAGLLESHRKVGLIGRKVPPARPAAFLPEIGDQAVVLRILTGQK